MIQKVIWNKSIHRKELVYIGFCKGKKARLEFRSRIQFENARERKFLEYRKDANTYNDYVVDSQNKHELNTNEFRKNCSAVHVCHKMVDTENQYVFKTFEKKK